MVFCAEHGSFCVCLMSIDAYIHCLLARVIVLLKVHPKVNLVLLYSVLEKHKVSFHIRRYSVSF
ncbi:hypothetical protein GCM10009332_05070 [Shewanella gelidii]|uniref:Uncharacterized protein n=1 Tax=Shewanella gelidii TaxID=1642821 RepID=A0A917JJC2_9GAMM|nr:hypothetical protein GCM10009332_05070 [Shewanella gelidii]